MWRDDRFYYSIKLLKSIASNYFDSYESKSYLENQSIAEGRADFDRAFRLIGRGQWIRAKPIKSSFKDYHSYNRLQQIVIADVLGVADYELEGLGFYRIPQLRGYAYYLMKKYLNGENDDN